MNVERERERENRVLSWEKCMFNIYEVTKNVEQLEGKKKLKKERK